MDKSSMQSESSWKLGLAFPLLSFLVALRFLTVLPISWKSEKDGLFFKASVIWFPLVGLLIGLSVSGILILISSYCSTQFLAVVLMILLAGFSGFLHLDGLADSADGLLSNRPRERALEIMRDSRIGAMGVVALFFLLLAKFAALSTLPVEYMIAAGVLMPVAGRSAILLSMALLPYARQGEGLGLLFYGKERYITAAMGLLFFFCCSLLFSRQSLFSLLFTMLIVVLLFSRWCFTVLGGATGDTLGAVCELSELTVAVTMHCLQ